MKRKSIKFLSLFLALVMCFSAMPVFQLEAEAATTYVVNGVKVPIGKWTNGGPCYLDNNGKGNCRAFAGYVYPLLWNGKTFNSYVGTSDDMLRSVKADDQKITVSNTEKFIKFAALGATIRVADCLKGNDATGTKMHSLILIQKDSKGFTTYDSNVTLNGGKHTRIKYWTWQTFTDDFKSYKYFKYIKWPGAPAFNEVSKPSAPSISSNVTGDVALNKPVTVSWGSVSGATGYKVYINGSQVTTTTSTSYAFKASDAKKYEVTVYAYNSKYTSSASNKITLTAHNPSKVTFLNYDGSKLTANPLSVEYGANVVAPEIPVREGYTFTGWDKSLTSIKADTTIKAQFKINTYTVKFLDSNGNTLSSQKINYGSTATVPSDPAAPLGYKFIGWSTEEYLNVKEDINVYGVYEWARGDLQLYLHNVTATRQEDGYYVRFSVLTDAPIGQRGRAVVTLKTSDGKLVDTTESAAFSILKSSSKTMEVFVPCDNAAAKAEVMIVDSYTNGVPISNNESAEIENGLTWSDWSETAPAAGTYTEIETKTQYRYKDKQFSTASSKTKDGWTYYKTTSTTSSGSTTSNVTAFSNDSQVRTVSTRKVNNYKTRTYYDYYHYSKGTSSSPVYYNGWSGKHETPWFTETLHGAVDSKGNARYSTANGARIYDGYKCSKCSASQWYANNTKTEQYVASTTTYYDYKDTFYTYHFYKWGDWSGWSDSVVTANADKEVETRTVYRYKGQFANNDTDSDGVIRTVSGTIGDGYEPKDIILFVYKIDDASDYTNEYVGQTTTKDKDGRYSFTFKLREEPTVKTGDYTMAIGVSGTNERMIIGTIEAPKPTYKVNFYNDGEKLGETQIVEEGKAATMPENPVREGYTFVGWNADTTNIRSDVDVEALFVQNKYTVVFVDFVTQSVNVKEFFHGDVLTPPEMKKVEGYSFIGWDELIGEDAVVTENMVLTANYKKDIYTVEFYDFDNNLIDTQSVFYGESATEPTAPSEDNMSFIDWESNEDYTNVTGNIRVNAVYIYNETCEIPYADVKTGEYSETKTITLNCDTENAVTFYTTDGTDPLEFSDSEKVNIYSEPITVDKSTVLKFYASALNMNDSEVVTETYAINNGSTESGLMVYDDIPEIVMNNLDKYSLKSAAGYRYKNVISTSSESESESLSNTGWTLFDSSFSDWSDWSMTKDAPKGTVAEYREQDPAPVDTPFYSYSHWKYNNGSTTVISAQEVPGTNGEWEYVEFENSLPITSFVSGKPAYAYNGENWFSQTIVTKGVVPDYKLYSYRTMTKSFYQWTDWTLDVPSADETRETQNDTVFFYNIPVMHVVTVHPQEEGTADFSVFAYDAAIVNVGSDFYNTEGYDIAGWYLDETHTEAFDVENTPITSSIDLYPKYEAKTFNITFKYEDDSVIETQSVEYCEDAVEPTVNVPEGMIFVGWDSLDYTSVCADAVVTAIIKPESEVATVYLNKTEVTLYAESMFKLRAFTNIENAPVKWSSSNYDIADVDEDGFVTAVAKGEAIITAKTEDNMTATCVVKVEGDNSSKITLAENATIGFDTAGNIRGIKVGSNTVNDVVSQFVNKNIVFRNTDGNIVSGDDLITTGTVAELVVGDNVVASSTIIITGDVNCDGKINNRDVAFVTRYLVEKEKADFEYQLIALDANGDGNVNNRDAAMLSRYLVGKEAI